MQIFYPDLYPIHTIEDKVMYEYSREIIDSIDIESRKNFFGNI